MIGLALLLLAALPQQTQQQQPPPVFRTGTQIVEVDATVQDKSGRFVTDLKPEDFEILEDGQPQKVETLYLVTPQGTSVVPLATPAGPAGTPASPVAPERRVVIFYFDTAHMISPGALDRAKSAVEQYVKTSFHSSDVGGVVAEGKMANNRLTSDANELRTAVDALRPTTFMKEAISEMREWPRLRDEGEAFEIVRGGLSQNEALNRAVARACSDDQLQCQQAPEMLMEKSRRLTTALEAGTRLTLSALDALANGLSKLPGRKLTIVFTDGFVLQNSAEVLQDVVGRAGRGGVRFYTIDTRGLNKGGPDVAQMLVDDPAGGPAAFDQLEDAPNSLAVDTGGAAIRNMNDFGKALNVIAQDAGTYYVVGYRPTNTNFDGKFRKITVRVKREGVKVRARKGYLATPAPAQNAAPNQPETTAAPVPASAAPPATTSSPAPSSSAPPSSAPPSSSPDAAATSTPTAVPGTSGTTGTVVRAAGGSSAASAAVRIGPDRVEHARELVSASPSSNDGGDDAQRGWERYQKGDVEGARDALERAVARGASSPWVHYVLGQSEFALLHFPRAAAEWKVVVEKAPDFKPAYFDLADALLQASDYGEAIKVLRRASERWPTDPEVYNALGIMFVRRGVLDDAVASFRKAMEVAPRDSLGVYNLARALEMRWVKSRRYVQEMRTWVSHDEDRKDAIALYQKYLQMGGPYETSAREALGRLQWEK